MSATGLEHSPEYEYFKAIEEYFQKQRDSGNPLVRDDYHRARKWFQEGIPLTIVLPAIGKAVRERREREKKRSYIGLRYCVPAVEAAWLQFRELQVGAAPSETAAVLEPEPLLALLADGLPVALPERASWQERIRGLAGDAEAVEKGLAALENELLASLAEREGAEARREAAAQLEAALARVAARLPEAELVRARERLERDLLRRRWGLPVLSLFAVSIPVRQDIDV
ncbi:MAG TPA: hypothetical protein VF017_19930 [Thermoanaerobaculia bacterium]|nr:hypothetical protein [Thermoanaerobaculia bacterium]